MIDYIQSLSLPAIAYVLAGIVVFVGSTVFDCVRTAPTQGLTLKDLINIVLWDSVAALIWPITIAVFVYSHGDKVVLYKRKPRQTTEIRPVQLIGPEEEQ